MNMHVPAPGAAAHVSDIVSISTRDRLNELVFKLHGINRHTTNLAILKYCDFQGFMVTAQNSGTHWIKWMLSNAIAYRYGVAPPQYFNNDTSNDLIGHPKHERLHPHLPRVASSHSIPAYALDWAWLRTMRRPPPYAIVVRDIREAMASHWAKWRHTYDPSFTRYIQGDPLNKVYGCDVWWYMRFFNRWGEIAERFPQETLVLRYEDFRADPLANLRRLSRHFSLDLSDSDLLAGISVGSKEFMMTRQDPDIAERPIRPDGASPVRYSRSELELLTTLLDRNLKHDLGYRYFDSPRGCQVAPREAAGRGGDRMRMPTAA
jgi:hypothetical protein